MEITRLLLIGDVPAEQNHKPSPTFRPALLSNTMPWSCPYCGRDDFKSARGKNQHLATNKRCKQAHENDLSAKRASEAARWNGQWWQGRAGAELPGENSNQLGESQFTRSRARASQAKLSGDVESPMEDNVGVFVGGDDNSDLILSGSGEEKEEELEDEGSIGIPAPQGQPNRAMYEAILKQCSPGRFVAPLDRRDVSGVKLIDVLR